MLKLLQYLVYPKESSQTQDLNNRLLNALLWATMASIPLTLVSLALDWPSGVISHGTSLLALMSILIWLIGSASVSKIIRGQDPNSTFKHQNPTKRWLTLRATALGLSIFIFFFLVDLTINPIIDGPSVVNLPKYALIALGLGIVVGLIAYAVEASIASDKRRPN
ncbi:MAG TPA: hypothetical protein DCW31_09630 [Lactobacillus sp.]|nr:hypothetical protein [Lactobacillus sp.]